MFIKLPILLPLAVPEVDGLGAIFAGNFWFVDILN